jgi:TPR repeat protein
MRQARGERYPRAMQTFLLILPDFALILLGALLRSHGRFAEGFWSGLERLVYFVLFPALLFHANLGLIYVFGEGVDRDLECAVCFLDKAVLCGSSDACLVLAEAYENGDLGLSVDYLRSADFYLKAARLGSFKAIRALGDLLGESKISGAELSVLMRGFGV